MRPESPLTLRFRLVDSYSNALDQSASAVELSDFFRLVNDATRGVLVAEAERIIDAIELTPTARLDVKGQLVRRAPTLSRATQVSELGRGSIVLDLVVDPARLVEAVVVIVLWTLKKSADEAWEHSPIRRRIADWATGAFERSRETAEHALSSSHAQRLSVSPEEVVETETHQGRVIEITIVRLPLEKPGDWERAARWIRDEHLL
jgi:hypothetical protein